MENRISYEVTILEYENSFFGIESQADRKYILDKSLEKAGT